MSFGVNGSGFVGPQVCVYNRTKLLAGNNTAEQVCHLYSSGEDGLFPADQDSPTNPPTGQDPGDLRALTAKITQRQRVPWA